MCGSLRAEHIGKKAGQDPQPEMLVAGWGGPGSSFSLTTDKGQVVVAEFNGHARDDKIDAWLKGGWEPGRLHVDKYTEGHRELQKEFDVPKGQAIKCLVRKVGKGQMVFKVVTREAKGTERDVHNRFPMMVKK